MTFLTDRRRLLRWMGLAPALAVPAGEAAMRTPPMPAPAPAPSREPLTLLRTRVNGERYYDAPRRFATLAVGEAVSLRREPDNGFDRRAIEVFDRDGAKLGYVARIDNSAVARMMDAGERFEARIARLSPPMDIRLEVDWLPA